MHWLTEMSQKQHFTKYGFWSFKDDKVTRVYVSSIGFYIHLYMYELRLAPLLPLRFHTATLESFGDKDTL
jgi:Gpi18-like mannosyltransferase